LRFVHSSGRGGAAVEWIASRQLALITVPQLHVEKEEEAYVGAARIGRSIRCTGPE